MKTPDRALVCFLAAAAVGLALRRSRIGLARAAIPSVAVAALVGGLLVPPSTTPIDGQNAIPALTTVEINGRDPRLLLRGTDATKPVLLFLAGGPGGTELDTMGRWGGELEKDFVVATVDGASYSQIEPTSTLTTESAVADIHATAAYLKDRFGVAKVYLGR